MSNKNKYSIKCPFCEHIIEVSSEWLMQNDRIGCMNCNKSFEAEVDPPEFADFSEDFGIYDSSIDSGEWD